MEKYQYDALPSRTSIRLIKFNQEESRKGPLVTCSFVIADALSPPEYIALSYVWGDASDTVAVSLEGKAMKVTKNLAAALTRFSKTPALLWADALCINQEDDVEKSHQVNMMAEIYGKATNATVWLGPDHHNDAPSVFQAFKELIEGTGAIVETGGRFGNFDEDTGDLHWQLRDGTSGVLTLPKIFVDPDQGDKAKLERFLQLPWFSRTWTLQEVGLAANVAVLWGGLASEWHPIGLTAMFLKRYCQSLLFRLGLTAEVEQVFHAYTTFSPLTPLATFIHVIHNVRRFGATKPQDKVYALLSHPTAHTIGITKYSTNWSAYKPAVPLAYHLLPTHMEQFMVQSIAEERATSRQLPVALPPPLWQADYSKSVAEVYRDVALGYINRTKSLEILTTVQHPPDDNSELFSPSWVPRWDYFIDTTVLGLYNSTHIASANKDVILTPSPSAQLDTLIVRGTLISRVVHHTGLLEPWSFDLPLPDTPVVGPDSPEVQGKWATNPIAKTWLQRLVHKHPESYPVLPNLVVESQNGPYAMVDRRASNLYRAFIRTWVAGKNMGEVDGFDLSADSDAYWDRLFWGSERDPQNQLSTLLTGLASPDEWVRGGRENKTRWKRYRDAAVAVCNKRKFFITKKGLVGLGPGAMREDDFVAVLLGADVPFVIREVLEDGEEKDIEVRRRENKAVPVDRKFQLIGECYVDGLMQGQATRGVEFGRDIRLI